MIGQTYLKVCGLTRVEDARHAAALGFDYVAFNLYPKSPRYISLAAYGALAPGLPAGPKRVAVLVEPSDAELAAARAAGFDRFQIHARADLPLATVSAWSQAAGGGALWLAPKLPPGAAFPSEWLALANTFLVDTFHAEGFGGSGRTGDWSGFAHLAAAHPEKTWILAGGLNPDNVRAARASSGARFLDVNSGVESSPGIKDAAKLAALASALRD
ncbi:MAG: hypothetical protein RL376_700 [Verrucomicrobiota bacterium]|jgi:phosphoribosylanthranilate isomerase